MMVVWKKLVWTRMTVNIVKALNKVKRQTLKETGHEEACVSVGAKNKIE